MMPNTGDTPRFESAVIVLLALVWALGSSWLTTVRRYTHRTTTRIDDRGQALWEWIRDILSPRIGVTQAATEIDEPEPSALVACAIEYVTRRLAIGIRVVPPTATATVALVSMIGLAAAQPGTGGVCDTPVIPLVEWAAQTGAGVLFLGGLLYGGYKHARAGLSRDPERANAHRRRGTMSMVAGPIFGISIVMGKQAAGAAGFNAAQCAELTPWI